jgi:N-acetylglucosaminyl-diphospho-decaprenol L-rhamnosyltransferase
VTPDTAIILVGYNSLRFTRDCLRSIEAHPPAPYSIETIYVDNNSADGSVEMVRREFPSVRVIANRENVGFCGACNQGARVSTARYLYLLNNDTVLSPNTLAPLIRFLDDTPRAGAAGNRLLNADGSEQWSARRYPGWRNALLGRRTPLAKLFANSRTVREYLYKDQLAKGEPFVVDWIPGSCTLVRRAAYFDAGELPKDMHYWSDALFCSRLQRLGWELFIVPSAPLTHFEGNGTGGKTPALRRWLIEDFHRGAYRFYCEHYSLGQLNPIRWAALAGLELRARLLIQMAEFAARDSQRPRKEGGA